MVEKESKRKGLSNTTNAYLASRDLVLGQVSYIEPQLQIPTRISHKIRKKPDPVFQDITCGDLKKQINFNDPQSLERFVQDPIFYYIEAQNFFQKGVTSGKDAPDNLYVLISGRIKTYTQSSLESGRIIEYLYKGTCFGIISLLTDEAHSVTVEAANDS